MLPTINIYVNINYVQTIFFSYTLIAIAKLKYWISVTFVMKNYSCWLVEIPLQFKFFFKTMPFAIGASTNYMMH